MKRATLNLAGAAILTLIGSAASAQEAPTGVVTQINRVEGTIAIKRTQSGTVGANTGTAGAEEFKAQDGAMLEKWHAGDRVRFTASEVGGVKTVTKLEKQ